MRYVVQCSYIQTVQYKYTVHLHVYTITYYILYIYYYISYTLTQVPQYTNDIAMLFPIQSQPTLIT